MPRMAIAADPRHPPSWKPRHSRPCGCSSVAAFASGMVIRPSSFELFLNSASSLTELGRRVSAAGIALRANRRRKRYDAQHGNENQGSACVKTGFHGIALALFRLCPSDRDGLAIGRLPTPCARAVAALDHALLVDLRDDVAVAGEQRLGRAHLGTKRQLAFGQAVGAVFDVFGFRAGRLPARPSNRCICPSCRASRNCRRADIAARRTGRRRSNSRSRCTDPSSEGPRRRRSYRSS